MKIAVVKNCNSPAHLKSCNLHATVANIKLTLFDLERNTGPKPSPPEMSFFKKIVMSPEMSSKMEVMVPEHPADNSSADLRGILCGFSSCVSLERHGDING